MYCSNCGKELQEGAKYCSYCGEKTSGGNRNQVKTVLLRCKQCNGELSIDEKQQVMCCPYCGSKEIIIESDSVKTAQIHASAYRDVEFGKQQTAVKMKQMDIDERNKSENDSMKKKILGFFLMLGSIGFFIWCVDHQNLFSDGSAVFITVLCIMTFIAGRRLWKNKKNKNDRDK